MHIYHISGNIGEQKIWRNGSRQCWHYFNLADANALATALSALLTSLLVSSFPCKSSLRLKNLKSVTVAFLQ